MNYVELIGWLGAIPFILSAIPQAWLCYKQGHAKGVSGWLLFFWMSGELFTLAYVSLKDELAWPLIVNYLVNIVFISVIIKYKVRERV